jgi:hypothetical protein
MNLRGWILVLLAAIVAVPALFLAVREERLRSLTADSEAKEIARLKAEVLRAEERSLRFSEHIDKLEQELESARKAPAAADASPPAGNATAMDASRLAAVETSLQGALQLLEQAGRAQGEQGEAAKSALRALEALQAKVAALEAESAKSRAELTALAQSVSRLGESLDRDLAEVRSALRPPESLAGAPASCATVPADTDSAATAAQGDGKSPDTEEETAQPPEKAEPAKPPESSDEASGAIRPLLVAELRAVDDEKGVVILGKGESDGVRLGDRFTVMRAGRAIGEIKVIRLWERYSGAEVVTVAPGEQLAKRDVARNFGDTTPGPDGPPAPEPKE